MYTMIILIMINSIHNIASCAPECHCHLSLVGCASFEWVSYSGKIMSYMYQNTNYCTRRNIGENNIWRNHFGRLNVGDFIKLYFICTYKQSDFNVCMLVLGMETHVFDSCIRGHHTSKDPWTPVINEELVCAQVSGNPHDPYAVAIKKGSLVVGHVPRKFQAFVHCSYSFIDKDGVVGILLKQLNSTILKVSYM